MEKTTQISWQLIALLSGNKNISGVYNKFETLDSRRRFQTQGSLIRCSNTDLVGQSAWILFWTTVQKPDIFKNILSVFLLFHRVQFHGM